MSSRSDAASRKDAAPRKDTASRAAKTSAGSRGGSTRSRTAGRFDTGFSTSTSMPSNARTRIVGARDGVLADAIVAVVRTSRKVGAALATAARAVGSVVTALGWAILAVLVLGFAAGFGLGWIEVLAIAWTALALVLLALFFLIGRSGYEISLRMPTERVVVGETAAAEIVVTNPSRRRATGVTIEIPVGEGLAEFAMPSLAGGAEYSDVFLVPTSHRGVIPIGPVRTVRGDPVGLLRRELVWEVAHDLYVHPRTISIPSTSTGLLRDLEGSSTRDVTSNDMSFHALREYLPGDERRNIHWKSTARTGTYMVRQFEETRRSHLIVALSLSNGDFASDEEFELAVSVAGSLGVRAIRDSRTLAVVVSEKTPEFAKRTVFALKPLRTMSRTSLLDDLSLVESDDTALPLADLARVAADDVAGVSVAFLVCGSTVTGAQLRAASMRFPLGVEVVAVVCDPGITPSLRRIAELSVVTIGYLEDLQKSLARAAAV
ncbi:DUF58 domain-containing protein [Compostimonas suwonensis]|uniref:Uncharacterized protein (DUF58 family) n=1 Tax=Compostimonas suwonensis TaxID=1048394 RepID=A0A2M9BUD5_9MICO|nr:DUF58 domain-containing protein [Compostimonas suwonensis]PJJ61564.1 uncharacterized protein (DUF58 family) [Compostimonas suwonensis]